MVESVVDFVNGNRVISIAAGVIIFDILLRLIPYRKVRSIWHWPSIFLYPLALGTKRVGDVMDKVVRDRK